MTDLAFPIHGVDALHAHFAEWVRFLDAKGIELEAQLAKLEAAKKKRVNGVDAVASPSPPPKALPLVAPASTEPVRFSNSVDWLDDGLESSKEAVLPQSADSQKVDEFPLPTEEFTSDAGTSADDDEEGKPADDSTITGGTDPDDGEVLAWLAR